MFAGKEQRNDYAYNIVQCFFYGVKLTICIEKGIPCLLRQRR